MRQFWYIAAEANELGNRPLARQVLGEPLVLFRDEQGAAIALFDRCPHRNAPLSDGRINGGRLMCPYHGWEFDGSGRCTFIPSLREGEAIPAAAQCGRFPVVEQDGYVWVWMGEGEPGASRPFKLPHRGEPGWADARLSCVIRNQVDNVIENFIDCPHTGYVHGGLFRQPASHLARTVVRQVEDGVVIDIEEEQQTSSVLGRLLVGKHRVTHQDRFILPATVQVAYGFGPEREITGFQICTPESEFVTRVYVYVTWKMGWLTPLIRPFVPFVGRVVLNQDLGVLERQGELIQRHGARFTSTPADTANLWIQACRKRAAEGQPPLSGREKQVEFRL
ncbi:MAG TPA: aromatic ring-hydroxylating dioxygenase subunit alpha [Oscillatoriaceae cyanobacterium]